MNGFLPFTRDFNEVPFKTSQTNNFFPLFVKIKKQVEISPEDTSSIYQVLLQHVESFLLLHSYDFLVNFGVSGNSILRKLLNLFNIDPSKKKQNKKKIQFHYTSLSRKGRNISYFISDCFYHRETAGDTSREVQRVEKTQKYSGGLISKVRGELEEYRGIPETQEVDSRKLKTGMRIEKMPPELDRKRSLVNGNNYTLLDK